MKKIVWLKPNIWFLLFAVCVLSYLGYHTVKCLYRLSLLEYDFPKCSEGQNAEIVCQTIKESIGKWEANNRGEAKTIVIWARITFENNESTDFAFQMRADKDYLANLKLEVGNHEHFFQAKTASIIVTVKIVYKPYEVA